MRDPFSRADVRVTVTLPDGRRQQFGYAFPEETFDRVFAPLPKMRELHPMDQMEAQQQRERRRRAADVIARSLADAILTAAEYGDTQNGYEKA
jgi:hypothetical protein